MRYGAGRLVRHLERASAACRATALPWPHPAQRKRTAGAFCPGGPFGR